MIVNTVPITCMLCMLLAMAAQPAVPAAGGETAGAVTSGAGAERVIPVSGVVTSGAVSAPGAMAAGVNPTAGAGDAGLIRVPGAGAAGVVSTPRDGEARMVPMPRAETADVVCEWLTRSGFRVSRTRGTGGGIEIRAIRGADEWAVSITPHSPLASDVEATYAVNGEEQDTPVKSLWSFLDGYARGPSAKADTPGTGAPASTGIPMSAGGAASAGANAPGGTPAYTGVPAFNRTPGPTGVPAFNRNTSATGVPASILEKIESIVCISADNAGQRLQFTGFVVDSAGLILCTAHNLDGIEEVRVTRFDGKGLEGEIIGIDLVRDIALIDVTASFGAAVSLAGHKSKVGMGERIFSVGCPESLGGTVYPGFVNGPPRLVGGQRLLQADMQVYPGSSGSPVFDARGNLVAMVKGRFRGTDSMGFLIPHETILAFIRDHGKRK